MPSVSDEDLIATLKLIKKHGSAIGASRATGIARSTIQSRAYTAAIKGLTADTPVPPPKPAPEPPQPPQPPLSDREVRDLSFWKARAKSWLNRATEAEHLAELLAGIRGVPIDPVPFGALTDASAAKGAAVGCILVSDVHAGEVISENEISGVNVYDPEICRRRLRRLFQGAAVFIERAAADCRLSGVVVFLAGDLVSGDIHLELRMTNALTAHEQVKLVVEELDSGIAMLQRRFGKVHVVSVPGNHGRVAGDRPMAKMASRLSYDTLVASILADRYRERGGAGVTFQIPNSVDALVEIFGQTILVTHGDRIGTGGGAGFAGPGLPIIRGHKKIELQGIGSGMVYDLVLTGHYHHSHASSRGLGNGSVVGYSEFAGSIRASVEPPQQWCFLLHSKWGLRERIEIKLEDPTHEKPRVRVKAFSSPRET